MKQLAYSLLPVRRFFAKHHAVIFVSISALLLALAIFMLYTVLTTATSDTTTQTSSLGGFDQQTIDKIKKLHDSSDSSDTLVFPSSHPNPFAE